MTTTVAKPGASPSDVHDAASAGDATTDRFRYQHRAAAIQFCNLLLKSDAYDAVYCEHWDDILVRCCDGKYVAIQIKSRAVHLPPFKTQDDEIIGSIARFVWLDKTFPGAFVKFRFATNHALNCEAKAGNNPIFVIGQFVEKPTCAKLRKNNPVRLFAEAVGAKVGCTNDELANVLGKLEWECHGKGIDHNLGALHDILCEAVPDLNDKHPRSTLQKIADNLTFKAYEASGKEGAGDVSSLYDVVQNFSDQRDSLIVAGKLVDAAAVNAIISTSLSTHAENELKSRLGSKGVPDSDDTMTKKLTYGGLENERVDRMKDFKTSMEAQYLRWSERFDVATANSRLDHLKVLIGDDCTEAKVKAEQGSEPVAPPMYEELRSRVKDRVAQKEGELYECGFEQLLGVAGIMTEECKVWWSDKFDIDIGTKS